MNKLYKSLHSYILSTGTVIISLLQQRSLEINQTVGMFPCTEPHLEAQCICGPDSRRVCELNP